MKQETARPQYRAVEVQAPQTVESPQNNETPAEAITHEFLEENPQKAVSAKPVFENSAHTEHKLRKFIFLIPAVLIIIAIALAAYFTKPEEKDMAVENNNQSFDTLPEPTVVPTIAPEEPLVFFSNDSFKFSYPRKLTLYECSSSIFLNSSDEQSIEAYCASNFADAIVKISTPNSLLNTSTLDILSEEEISVSGVQANEIEYRGNGGSFIFTQFNFKDNNYLFELFDPQYKNEFNDILGTFELIYDKTADWQFFENLNFGYSLKYPPNWVMKIDLDKEGKIVSPDFVLSKSEASNLQTLDVRFTTTQGSAAISASEIISSSKSLSGWDNTPVSEFRSIGGANATVIKGEFKGVWNEYVVIWYRSTVVEMIWQDSLDREYDETLDLILASWQIR